MALRRALSLRSLLSPHRYNPCITRHDDIDHEDKSAYRSFLLQRSFSSSNLSQHLRSCSNSSLVGVSIFQRSMSTSGSDETGNVNDVAATPMMENVVTDWSIHFDVVHRSFETVHSFTGLDRCAYIVLTTFLIRGVTVPLMIQQARDWSRIMKLLIHSTTCAEIREQGGDLFLAKHQTGLEKFVKECGGVFYLSYFPILHIPALMYMGLTIHNMTEKVAFFKTGGALWLTDITMLNTSFFPLLTGLTFWITVEYDAIVGFEGSLIALRKLSRCMVIPVVVLGLFLSKEVHCYLMSCMLFSIASMHVIRRPGVKKHLGFPEVPGYMLVMLYKKLFRNRL